jgi:hypothetical protein
MCSDKIRYEKTDRQAGIETQIRNNLQQYRQVADDIKSAGELFKELGGEFCK